MCSDTGISLMVLAAFVSGLVIMQAWHVKGKR